MAKINVPHLVCLFQDLESKIQDLGTFLFHAHIVQQELKDIWQEVLEIVQASSEDD